MLFSKKGIVILLFFAIAMGQNLTPAQKEQAAKLMRENPGLASQIESDASAQTKNSVDSSLLIVTPPPSVQKTDDTPSDKGNTTKDIARIDPSGAKKEIYGRSFFRQDYTTLVSGYVPDNYVIVEGDQVLLRLWGRYNLDKSYTIGQDGYVFIELLNKQVYIKGMTQRALKETINNVVTGMTGVQGEVRVISTHPIKVNIIGQAKIPGTILVPPYCTFWQALVLSRGPSEQGSIRDIRLERGGSIIATFDLYSFLKTGKIPDIVMKENDLLFFADLKNVVEIKGIVRRPALYEVTSSETMGDLMDFASGLEAKDISPLIEVERLIPAAERNPDSPTRRILDLKASDAEFKSFVLRDGDIISERLMQVEIKDYVNITGLGVNVPGRYSIKGQTNSLWDVVKKAGDLVKGYSPNIEVVRKTPQGPQSIKLVINNQDEAKTFPVQKGDSILTYHETQFLDSTSISVFGFVRDNVKFPYSDSLTLQSVIRRAGGLRDGALPYVYIKKTDDHNNIRYETVMAENAENYRMAKRDEVYTFDYKKFNEKFPVVVLMDGREPLILEFSNDLSLNVIIHRLGGLPSAINRNQVEINNPDFSKPGFGKLGAMVSLTPSNLESIDLIREGALVIFRKDIEKGSVEFVCLAGEFENPGPYALLSKTENLADFMKRVGVFTSRSNPYSLNIVRKGSLSKIPIDVESISPFKIKGKHLLVNYDTIFVSRNDNIVEVAGEVFNPSMVSYFEGQTWKGYINAAGGTLDSADIKNIYIIYPNGNASKAKTGFFSSSRVVPGSKIVVPHKLYVPPKEKSTFDYKEMMAMTSATMTLILTALIIDEKLK